jgi:hypothetical protein
MAAGRLPKTGTLSVNDINVAFYGSPPSNNSLSSAIDDICHLSKPKGINDLRGCPYCQICVGHDVHTYCNSFEWEASADARNKRPACLTIIPYETFTVVSQPTWICITDFGATSFKLAPQSAYPSSSRFGVIRVCDINKKYNPIDICVSQRR